MRTTTAFITWPFFTRPFGIASLTDTTIVSPMVAYLRFEPPSTLMHWTRRAPELSATSRFVSIWIIAHVLLSLAACRNRPKNPGCPYVVTGEAATPPLAVPPMLDGC